MTQRTVFFCAFALTLILIFAACTPAPPPEPKRDVAADMKVLNALRDQYVAGVNSGDAAAVAATLTDDAIDMGPYEPAVEGKEAIQVSYETMFKEYTVKIGLTALETQVLGDWGYDRGTYTITLTPKTGKPIEDTGKYLDVLKRLPDGSWKVSRSIYNTSNPPPGKAEKKKK